MFKYKDYIKESKVNFSIGDKVIYNSKNRISNAVYYKKYDGKFGEIIDIFPYQFYKYRLRLDGDIYIVAGYEEISKINDETGKNNLDKMKKFKVGDKVIFTSLPSREYYKKHDGKICKINFCYPNHEYQILTQSSTIIANEAELKHADDKTTSNYVEKQFEPGTTKNKLTIGKTDGGSLKITTSSTDDLLIGQRVIANGHVDKYEFKNRKGTIKKVSSDSYVIEFDEDDSKNQKKFSMMVDKNIVKPINEPKVVIMKVGNEVICTDKSSTFFNKIGIVTRTWSDGQAMVEFKRTSGNAIDGTIMNPEQVKITKYSNSSTFDKKETSIPVEVASTEMEEEDDDEVTDIKTEKFKKSDLLEFSYKDFLLSEKISTKEDLLKNKEKYENILKDKSLQEFKLIVYEKSLRIAEIVEQYFDFLEAKVAKGLPVYRTVEQLDDNTDLLITKTKVRASESKEMSRKYSFDQGIIAYWKFKDAVIFRTI